MIRYGAILLMAALVAACGDSGDEKPEGAIPEHMLESMDKAENVEDVLEQADQQRREQGEG